MSLFFAVQSMLSVRFLYSELVPYTYCLVSHSSEVYVCTQWPYIDKWGRGGGGGEVVGTLQGKITTARQQILYWQEMPSLVCPPPPLFRPISELSRIADVCYVMVYSGYISRTLPN